MLSSSDFSRLIVEGERLPGDIHSKIFTCVPYRLSWSSRIGGAVLLVGIRRAEGRMYKTGIVWNWTGGGNEEPPGLGWWVRIGIGFFGPFVAPWRFADSGRRRNLGCGVVRRPCVGNTPALNGISRKLAYTCKTISLNFNMKIAKRKKFQEVRKLTKECVRKKIIAK